MNDKVDIVIAGAGLAGALFACQLAASPAGRQLSIRLVEPKLFVANYTGERFDPRVVALTEASRRQLDALGVWQRIVAYRCCPYRTMEVRDAEGTGAIVFDANDVHQLELGHIVENSLIIESLLATLAQWNNVTLVQASIATVISRSLGQVVLKLDNGEQLQTALLVAADGARSGVREMAGLRVREWHYGHQAMVTTIATEREHQYCARQWFSPDGPLAFLPLRGQQGDLRRCSIVWSQRIGRAETLMALPDSDFCEALSRASEQSLGRVIGCDKRFSFPLLQRHAVDYVTEGIVLLGDAAHSIHPLAGQGVNLGFKDARVLAEELNRAVARGLSLGDLSVLGRYQRRRKPDNLGMMALMEGFKRLFESELPAARVLRNEGMSAVNQLNILKNMLVKQAIGW